MNGIERSQRLKSILTRISQLTAEKKELTGQHQAILNRLGEIKNALSENEQERLKLQNAELTVSEHALLRYCERVHGIDLAQAREKMLTPQLREYVERFGNGEFPVNGFSVRVRDNVVITLISNEEGKP